MMDVDAYPEDDVHVPPDDDVEVGVLAAVAAPLSVSSNASSKSVSAARYLSAPSYSGFVLGQISKIRKCH